MRYNFYGVAQYVNVRKAVFRTEQNIYNGAYL